MIAILEDMTLRAQQISRDIITLLKDKGTGDYIGESISQLEHCLQCANFAVQAGKIPLSTAHKVSLFPRDFLVSV